MPEIPLPPSSSSSSSSSSTVRLKLPPLTLSLRLLLLSSWSVPLLLFSLSILPSMSPSSISVPSPPVSSSFARSDPPSLLPLLPSSSSSFSKLSICVWIPSSPPFIPLSSLLIPSRPVSPLMCSFSSLPSSLLRLLFSYCLPSFLLPYLLLYPPLSFLLSLSFPSSLSSSSHDLFPSPFLSSPTFLCPPPFSPPPLLSSQLLFFSISFLLFTHLPFLLLSLPFLSSFPFPSILSSLFFSPPFPLSRIPFGLCVPPFILLIPFSPPSLSCTLLSSSSTPSSSSLIFFTFSFTFLSSPPSFPPLPFSFLCLPALFFLFLSYTLLLSSSHPYFLLPLFIPLSLHHLLFPPPIFFSSPFILPLFLPSLPLPSSPPHQILPFLSAVSPTVSLPLPLPLPPVFGHFNC